MSIQLQILVWAATSIVIGYSLYWWLQRFLPRIRRQHQLIQRGASPPWQIQQCQHGLSCQRCQANWTKIGRLLHVSPHNIRCDDCLEILHYCSRFQIDVMGFSSSDTLDVRFAIEQAFLYAGIEAEVSPHLEKLPLYCIIHCLCELEIELR